MSEIATRDQQQTPARQLVSRIRGDKFRQEIELALPRSVSPDRFIRGTVTALLQNPEIATAELDSVFQAVIRSAQDGLLPDGREAALVMFGRKAVYMPMIGGFRKIAAEHGWGLTTRVVYENDEFEHTLGVDENIIHVPARPGAPRGKLHAAYAIGRHKDGRRELEVMYREDVEKAKAVSRAAQKGPWVDWEERMWEKTVGRRLFAKLPLGDLDQERITRLLAAAELDPADATAALYGPAARLAFTDRSPSGDAAGEGGDPEPASSGQASIVDAAAGRREDALVPPSAGASSPDTDPDTEYPDEPGDEHAAGEPDGSPSPGATVIGNGKHAGKTIADAPESWRKWCLGVPDHPNHLEVSNYCRDHEPALWQEAIAAAETRHA